MIVFNPEKEFEDKDAGQFPYPFIYKFSSDVFFSC